MSGFQTLGMPRPRLSNGRPATPVVPWERCRPVAKTEQPAPELPPLPEPPVIATRDILAVASPDWPEFQTFPRERARAIVKEVAESFGVHPLDIIGPRRQKNVVDARKAAICRVAIEFPSWSLPRIGKFFGGRDHSTILYHLRKEGIVR